MKTFVLCDSNTINSCGFRIRLEGMNLDRFRSNPVMLYQHDKFSVIGRWENVHIEDGRLLADAKFDSEDELARQVEGKVERGFLKGCSVGILINDMTLIGDVYEATATELMEASIVSIPSDAGAIRLMDENHNPVDFKTVKLSFEQHLNLNKMEKEQTPKVAELEATITEKDKRIAELEAAAAESRQKELDAYLAAKVEAGIITESEKQHFAKLAAQDIETVKAILDARPAQKQTSLSAMVHNTDTKTADRTSWSYLEWAKKDPKGLQKMRTEDPKEFERLQAEFLRK